MSSLEQLYQQVILDHAKRRCGCGDVSGMVTTSHQVNPTCGDDVTLGVVLTGDTLSDVVWQAEGCSISQASLSMMSELVRGRSLSEVAQLDEAFSHMMHSRGGEVGDETLDSLQDAASLHGTAKFPNRVKCALLGWMALRDAIIQAQNKE